MVGERVEGGDEIGGSPDQWIQEYYTRGQDRETERAWWGSGVGGSVKEVGNRMYAVEDVG